MYVCMCVRVCIKNANSIKSMKTIYVCMCLYNNNNNLAAAAKREEATGEVAQMWQPHNSRCNNFRF